MTESIATRIWFSLERLPRFIAFHQVLQRRCLHPGRLNEFLIRVCVYHCIDQMMTCDGRVCILLDPRYPTLFCEAHILPLPNVPPYQTLLIIVIEPGRFNLLEYFTGNGDATRPQCIHPDQPF